MFYSRKQIRELDNDFIRNFISNNKHLLVGDVIDFGCGNSPYEKFVTGKYIGFDPKDGFDFMELSGRKFDTVIVTQVLEEVDDIGLTMMQISDLTKDSGHVLWTFSTLWEEYDSTTKWRFTKEGAKLLAKKYGLELV